MDLSSSERAKLRRAVDAQLCRSDTCRTVLDDIEALRDCMGISRDGGLARDSLSCAETELCHNRCETLACRDRCIQVASPEGRAKFAAMQSCLGRLCIDRPLCRIGECRAPVAGCFDIDSETGSWSCRDVWRCEMNCSYFDAECKAKCFFSGTPAAQAEFTNLYECIQQHRCYDSACVLTNCGNPWSICLRRPD